MTAPKDYMNAVVAGLDRLGVPVLDSWTQEDDECWEGLIELEDDDTEGALAFAWHEEKGWEKLVRYGPREVSYGPRHYSNDKYTNTEDAAPADAAVEDVVRLITVEAGFDPDQTTLF